jgi:hypothetical protein
MKSTVVMFPSIRRVIRAEEEAKEQENQEAITATSYSKKRI